MRITFGKNFWLIAFLLFTTALVYGFSAAIIVLATLNNELYIARTFRVFSLVFLTFGIVLTHHYWGAGDESGSKGFAWRSLAALAFLFAMLIYAIKGLLIITIVAITSSKLFLVNSFYVCRDLVIYFFMILVMLMLITLIRKRHAEHHRKGERKGVTH